ncbi:MAG: hypothetical protein FFODKBPE_00133 [Candidatus Argoarchaeum ethanivorans]|uniref:Ribbon-helix-helix protein CopG domain-containing protein n=1 Tax=Candidatus Argoarchaeum ethanivorans TaxID=2608793 RepID=A0A811T9X1_9EURY|nr:MAG: hypothetical protein FFODKBPE_00133 [Candidatus Argoarchaeum ethanivorans]
MQIFCIRLPEQAIRELNAIARSQYMPVRTLARALFLTYLEELKNKKNVVGGVTDKLSPTTKITPKCGYWKHPKKATYRAKRGVRDAC